MTNLVESGAFFLLLVIAVAAMLRFPARRYLLILITATAVGAWLMGYASGYRTSSESLVPFWDSSRADQARAVVDAGQPSALWGLSLCAFIILADILAFGFDVRRSERKRHSGTHEPASKESGK
jgi:hypothetical protein